ncbi:MAG: M23 family metallopeptidase, partial [Candidatus Neomarinimicrobiota bacterium]
GQVVARFGQQRNRLLNTVTDNPGIDIQAKSGAPVRAVLDGLVTTVTYLRGYGTTVIIDHGKNLYTVYTHLEDVAVAEENYVDQGQVIAQVGGNGSLDGAKLHFEVWANQQKQDPGAWLLNRP